MSMAAAALERAINANLLRRWVVEAAGTPGNIPMAPALPAPAAAPRESFVALPMRPRAVEALPIKIELRRGGVVVSVQWPSSAGHECAMWLREVLK
jgi:transposase